MNRLYRMPLNALRTHKTPKSIYTVSPAAVCLALGLIATTPANAEILINETTTFYHISGNSAGELRHSINDSRNQRGDPYDATTFWSISWQFQLTNSGDSCRISSTNIEVNIEYLLPWWEHKKYPDQALVTAWNRYFKNLQRHEFAHGIIVRNTATNIETAIQQSNSSDIDCPELEALANNNAHMVVHTSREQHAAFDKSTDHGANCGAVFP